MCDLLKLGFREISLAGVSPPEPDCDTHTRHPATGTADTDQGTACNKQ